MSRCCVINLSDLWFQFNFTLWVNTKANKTVVVEQVKTDGDKKVQSESETGGKSHEETPAEDLVVFEPISHSKM